MLDQGAFSQQTGGSVQTSNPQTVPVSNLQPQQQSGLQGMGSQVMGTSTFLEQSAPAAITVNNQQVSQELDDLKTNQQVNQNSMQSIVAGREMWVAGGIVILIAVLAYVLVKQIMRERA